MLPLLRPGQQHERPATSAQTVAYIDAHSTKPTSLNGMQSFAPVLDSMRQAAQGSRHHTMHTVVSWVLGTDKGGLNMRDALQQITDAWLILTAGEGREDEVMDSATWAVGQQLARAVAAPADVYQPPDSTPDNLPVEINWREFAERESSPRSWLVEGFWPRGRGMALWAGAKEGKSELVLWCAGKLALGEHPWTGVPVEPIDVAYFDFEMTEDDLEERLDAFGFDLSRLNRLHYFLLPALYPFDKDVGGEQVMQLVRRCGAEAVIIDTFSRAVTGTENDADTVQDFYRYTGIRLKQAGIGFLRLDHSGKDPARGQRGSSAKRDDVDVIWRATRTKTGVLLNCEGQSRLGWVGPTLTVDRIDATFISYSAPIRYGWSAEAIAKAHELDTLKAPLDVTKRAAVELIKNSGAIPGRERVILDAIKCRREPGYTGVANRAPRPGTTPGHQDSGTTRAPLRDEPPDLFSDQGE
jgi:hypothetical protein